MKRLVPAVPKYIDPETKISVGDEYCIDSGVGGSHRVKIIEITDDKVTIEMLPSWYWDDGLPQYFYDRDSIHLKLYTLIPANPWDRKEQDDKV